MLYVEAPNYADYPGKMSIFLGGGITNCPPWQNYVIDKFKDYDIAIYNPRRANFPIDDPTQARIQIEWEFKYLLAAGVIMFWFPEADSVQPIALFELGKYLEDGFIYVGADPKYSRRLDLEIQLDLAQVKLYDNLDIMIQQIIEDEKLELCLPQNS